jgi:uncharacterized protein with PIN domain
MRTLIVLLSAFFILSLSSCVTHVRATPTKIVFIKTPPKHHKVVQIKGKRYYFWNGKHYKRTREGYVVIRV